jgi:hypothetical protein
LVGGVEDLILLLLGDVVATGFASQPFAESVASLLEVDGGLIEHDGALDDLLLRRVEIADFLSLIHGSLYTVDDLVSGEVD